MTDDFANRAEALFSRFGQGRKMVLSTALLNHVTARMMSVVCAHGRFYFQTDRHMRKCAQLRKNPNAALCIDEVQIEGRCEEIGTPQENPVFCALYRECFPDSFARYTHLKDERVFCLTPTYIQRWIYEEGQPVIESFDFAQRTYERRKYAGE